MCGATSEPKTWGISFLYFVKRYCACQRVVVGVFVSRKCVSTSTRSPYSSVARRSICIRSSPRYSIVLLISTKPRRNKDDFFSDSWQECSENAFFSRVTQMWWTECATVHYDCVFHSGKLRTGIRAVLWALLRCLSVYIFITWCARPVKSATLLQQSYCSIAHSSSS